MIDYAKEFELMRPYNDQEVSQAVHRLINYPEFDRVLSYLYPGVPLESIKKNFTDIETVHDFQQRFMYRAVNFIIENTSKKLTVSGQENIAADTPYLFVSNHRDIVMDAAILQVILLDSGHKTSQITFGSNLMSSPLIVDFGKLNKMFKFYRGGTRNEMYNYSLLHSAYIKETILNKKESVWIAQRNGRTKDGNDLTQPAMLKMLIGCNTQTVETLSAFNILPFAVSYEYEPCDAFKTRELYISSKQPYVKDKNEDLHSVLTGITSTKGNIHFAFGKPLNQFLESLDVNNTNERLYNLAATELDKQVHSLYKLHPNNYIAFDMLSPKPVFANHYTRDEFCHFYDYVNVNIGEIEGQRSELKRIFLNLYANPVSNRHAMTVS